MNLVKIYGQGPPDVLKYEKGPTPDIGNDQALVKLSAVGVNFTDVYMRSGMYPAKLPLVIGQEGAGTVSEVGSEQGSVKVGDQVAFTGVLGAYAEYAAVPVARLVKLPAGIEPRTAAAVLLQGMTAHYLLNDTYPVKPGETILVHAAAGGVGQLLVQMAKMMGARVLATASTEAKAQVARKAGADEAIVYTEGDFQKEVMAMTNGLGVSVVYDSVGKDTFEKSLGCLRTRGCLALFGQSSGFVPPVSPSVLQKGSLYLTRPMLPDYAATRSDLDRHASAVFEMVLSKKLKVNIYRTFPLSEASEAHRTLEGRKSTGKILLIP